MSETLNIDRLHTEGRAELHIGIREKQFVIRLSEDGNSIEFIKPDGTKLSLDCASIIQTLQFVELLSTNVANDGDIPIFKDSKSITSSGLNLATLQETLKKINNKADRAITLDGYGIKNAYTKAQIDEMYTSALKYKGSYNSFSELESAVTSNLVHPMIGDVYNIRTAGGVDVDGTEIKAGDNVIYNGTGWDNCGGIFDTSNLVKESEFSSEISRVDNTITEVNSSISTLETSINNQFDGLNTTLETQYTKRNEVYSKNEIDGKLTGALHYKGTYQSLSELETAVSNGTITPQIGDVYNITNGGGIDSNGTAVKSGDNVIYNGTGWDCSSGSIDMSAYATNTQLSDSMDAIQSTVNSDINLMKSDIQAQTSTINQLSSNVSSVESDLGTMQTTLNNKATKSTTLSGYGITNAYTKTQVDNKVPKVTVSTSAPSSSASGKAGDLWIVYE